MKDVAGNEVEEVRGGGRRGRRWKWWILLFAVLVAAGIAAGVFCSRERGVGEQLRAIAGESGLYKEKVLGPGWYVMLVDKYKLPALRRPVEFRSQKVTDEDMAIVGRAITLREVDLRGSRISDAGMVHLKGLTKMQKLYLDNTRIGDAGLAHLSELSEL